MISTMRTTKTPAMTQRSANARAISLARLARGLSQKELADRIGPAQGTVSKLENGLMPADPYIREIAEALGYPASFFYEGGGIYPAGIRYTRARKKLSATLSSRIDAENNIRARGIAKLLRSVEIANQNIPSLAVEDYGTPTEVARALREHWRVPRGPIRNLTRLFERHGGLVVHADFHTARFDGVYYRFPNPPVPPTVFLNEALSGDRLRFTLAHEIGHVVMHQLPVPAESAEPETDEFSAEFMMPAADIRPHLFNLDLSKLAGMKKVWGMSMAALIRRAKDLGTITPNKYKSLNIELRKACRGVQEPEYTAIPRERPKTLQALVEMHEAELGYSVGELSELVRLHEDEFRAEYMPRPKTAKILYLHNATGS